MKQEPNKCLIKVLESSPSEQADGISIVFRGNNKHNFTSRLTDKDIIILAECLIDYGEVIQHIDFSFNVITDAGAEAIASLLNHCRNIESLNLQGNSIDTAGGQRISESLKENFSLRYLNLQGNKIKTDGAMNVIEVLFSNKNLLELNLSDNEINHE